MQTGRMSVQNTNMNLVRTAVRDHSQDGVTYRVRTSKYDSYITISVEVLSIDGHEATQGHVSGVYKKVNDENN